MSRLLKLIVVGSALACGLALAAVSFGAQRRGHTKPVTVHGKIVYGQTLTVATGTWAGDARRLTYRWQLCDRQGKKCKAQARAGGAKFRIGAASVGHRVRVTVQATFRAHRRASRSALTAVIPTPAKRSASFRPVPAKPTTGQTVTLTASACAAAPCTDTWKVTLAGHAVAAAPGPRSTVTFTSSGTAKIALLMVDALGRQSRTQSTLTIVAPKPPQVPTTTTTTAPPTTTQPVATPTPVDIEHCYENMTACGYPTATSVGANCASLTPLNTTSPPAGTAYNAADNELEVEADNVRIDNTNLGGGLLYVGANNFTLDNSCMEYDGQDSDQTTAIEGDQSTTGLQIVNSTIEGANSTSQAAGALVSAPPDSTLADDVFENTSDAIGLATGSTLTNSYVLVNATTDGSHNEDIYFTDASVTIQNSTLLNTQTQTALVFGNSTDAPGGACDNHLTMTDNLLAGGGYEIYPCANADSVGTSSMNISGNDFARCLSTSGEDGNGGYNCVNGADSNGLFPRGGYFGVSDYIYCPDGASGRTWSDNLWDDNGAQVACVNGPGSGES